MRRVIAIGLMVLVVVSLVVSMLPPPVAPQPGAESVEVFLSPEQATAAGYRIIADVVLTPAAEQYFVNDVLAYKFTIGDVGASNDFLYIDALTGQYLQTATATITVAPGRIICQSGVCRYKRP